MGRAVSQWGQAGGTEDDPLQIAYGSATVVTDPLGGVTVDRYSSRGVLISQTVAGQPPSSREYDAWDSFKNNFTPRYEQKSGSG